MCYTLVFEKFTSDITHDCPVHPSDEEYELHLSAIVEDIKNINGVLDAKLDGGGRVIVDAGKMDKGVLADRLEPFLKEHFCYLRLSSETYDMLLGRAAK